MDSPAAVRKIKRTLSTQPEYRVELDVFNGPLDLLLYLLKRDELDIYDIPIARITDSYVEYVNMLRELKSADGFDINLAGDFLVMAATLMEIKSAMLLPKTPPATSDGSPSPVQRFGSPARPTPERARRTISPYPGQPRQRCQRTAAGRSG